MRFPRKQSINRREDFLRIRKRGSSKAGRFVIVSTLEDGALEGMRTAFITSKRSARKAHDRNLVRRRLRACVRNHASDFAEPGRYLVTIARPGAHLATFSELEADWLRQCKRLKLLNG